MTGLGDLVAWFIGNIRFQIGWNRGKVLALDEVFEKKSCGCQKRKELLNKIVPFSTK